MWGYGMKQRQEDAPDGARRSTGTGTVLLASALLLTGVVVGADQGARLFSESLRVMASDTQDKLVAQPLGELKRVPMVSEPYRPERLKDFKPPQAVAEPETVSRTEEVPAPDSEEATSEPEVAGFAECAGTSTLDQDICADPQLTSIDRRIAGAISDRNDPRYQEYLRQRQHWCAPQPSRRNRQECLLDLGTELLGKL